MTDLDAYKEDPTLESLNTECVSIAKELKDLDAQIAAAHDAKAAAVEEHRAKHDAAQKRFAEARAALDLVDAEGEHAIAGLERNLSSLVQRRAAKQSRREQAAGEHNAGLKRLQDLWDKRKAAEKAAAAVTEPIAE